jgi:hypothetical protein
MGEENGSSVHLRFLVDFSKIKLQNVKKSQRFIILAVVDENCSSIAR